MIFKIVYAIFAIVITVMAVTNSTEKIAVERVVETRDIVFMDR